MLQVYERGRQLPALHVTTLGGRGGMLQSITLQCLDMPPLSSGAQPRAVPLALSETVYTFYFTVAAHAVPLASEACYVCYLFDGCHLTCQHCHWVLQVYERGMRLPAPHAVMLAGSASTLQSVDLQCLGMPPPLGGPQRAPQPLPPLPALTSLDMLVSEPPTPQLPSASVTPGLRRLTLSLGGRQLWGGAAEALGDAVASVAGSLTRLEMDRAPPEMFLRCAC
jgi:hypothetical protein